MSKAWISCWQGVESLPVDAVKVLLSALARLPFSASIDPPPLPAISKAVSALLSQLTGSDSSFDGNDETLEGVELVERVVTRLLKFTWNLKRDDVKETLDEMIAQADSSLSIRLKTHRPVRGRLAELLTKMEAPWTIKVKVQEVAEMEVKETALPDWRHPTVAWLANYRNFQPTLLPKLQRPRTNEGRVYENTDEYFTTIVKLWIGMTFVEGNNALLPHCTVKMGEKVCDQPLWPFPGKEKLLNCKNSQCDRYATFLCAHRLHTRGYCSNCAGEYQQRLRGPPSKYASTHIYDGCISSVKYDGTISIEQFASRRPPLKPIHWRTTKRLSSPNLIGIVRLANREASLRATDEIYWAEITFQGKSFDEFKAREKGCLTLRLLQYLDEPGNTFMTHNPSVGDAVAIIDCQTFVPEFVPVLIALEKQRQLPVPFQDGALLNLSEEAVVFGRNRSDSGNYEDEGEDGVDAVDTTVVSDFSAPTRELIRKVIQFSLLDPIVDIRRDAALRSSLERSLLNLVNSATLDPGQLKSFAEAMMYPVHCTQGPPGTGKSYLGVVIVRALLVVRNLWKKKNREVGDPPILVLSYKNHAIDEFLLDLVRSEPVLDHMPGNAMCFGRYYLGNGFKQLVRIGGGCTEPELEQYRERNVAHSDPSVREASNRIESCQDLRDQWHKFRDCFAPIFEAQTALAGRTKTLSVDERKTVMAGVPALSKAVATLWTLSKNGGTSDAGKTLLSDDAEEKMPAPTDETTEDSGDEGTVKRGADIDPVEVLEFVLKNELMLTSVDIARLRKGIKHYDPDIDPQEYDNEDEVEESEHLQHMRDVLEVDDEVQEVVEVADENEEEEQNPWTTPDQSLILPPEWHWDMTLEERWNALSSVLNLWGEINAKLQHELAKNIENLKVEHQRQVLLANSRVYEGKAVIGGTITGCVSRLEAIRTTNPFAILVEEASEVMEPLLFSCFSSSTRKLEMIGDHMQLQPSVMGRIDFERVNKVNISMFERLINAPQGNEVPSSVLSIQRRMRKNICDLTRNFYDDITTIEDHKVCGTKLIGGSSKNAHPLLDACEGGGREVPGVSPHIFFWTHTGAQQRASVGLSRVNNQEANMTCKLVQYLVHCGVPAKSIAVLTPYKGQLMLMRKMLMTTYGLRTMSTGRDPKPIPSCFLSTVDRFQGDEADVVIISLVIDGKSRTPFVKLQNRMIVLLSRARLGMYVVGNVEYFGETAHWQKTLALLEGEAGSDNTEKTDCTTYTGPRIGKALPICCPEHRASVKLAKEDRDLKLGFCTVVCSAKLSCSHQCSLMCHWPQVDQHNKRCAVEVESPCRRHPRVLKCSAVAASAGQMSIDKALKKYQCDIQVEVSLPCGHDQKMKCHAHSEIVAGRDSWPVCTKTAIVPYVYDECKHILQCTCSEFDRYSKGLAPPCSEKVEYTPPCQHTVCLSCHDRQDYVSQVRRLTCKEKVKLALPRCGHEVVVSCPIAENLKQWTGEANTTLDFVQEGESYGPKDHFCKQTVKFQRRCGHHEQVRCERAFELAQSPSRCLEPVVVANPECGHECATTCFEKERLYEKVAQYSSFIDDIDPLEVVNEGDSSNFRSYGLNVQCSHEVTYVRTCGHKAKMKCSKARHVTAACEELPSKRDFLVRKRKVLERFKGGQDSNATWSNALFSPVEFPVFVVLNRKLQTQHIDKFELKDFGNQQFIGMEVYEATQGNLNRVVGTGKASVLFGHLFMVKYLKNPVDFPKNKGKKGAKLRDWVHRQTSHDYDAFYRDAKSGKEGGSWVVWSPYAMFPIHRVDITDANREVILQNLPEKSQVEQPPLKITFKKPNATSTADEEKAAASTQAPSILSVEELDKLRVLTGSVSPLFGELNVWFPWDGTSLSTGAAEAIPQRMEKTLASKLNFVPAKLSTSKDQLSKNPFGGINYLKNVQGQGKLKEDGNLFMAMEMMAVRKQDTAEARAKLEEYVATICAEGGSGYAHPLVIVAIARLAARLRQASSSDIHRKLAEIFAKLYLEASAVWLSGAEVAHVKTLTSSANTTSAIISGPVSVEDKWESLKSQYGCRSQAMDDLLKLVGLKKVKQAAVNLFKNAMILQQLSATQRKKNSMPFNYCFVGNPGTGKTTVARLFADVLKDSNIRRANTCMECTAQQLKDDGADEFRSKLKKAAGGVLFIDEAYELDPAGDFKGRPIVAELLTAAEDKRDDLSIILAGYEDDIQKKLYAYNDGLSSRFEEVTFEDFDARDLEAVWDGMARDRGWEYESAIAKVAFRRLVKAAGRKGFGNARAVRKLFEQAVKEAMAREDFDNTLKFQTIDLLGDRPSTNPKLQAVLNEVEEKTGWRKVKEEMKKLVRISDENYERELKGQETVPVCLNRLFLGNPGTGKTTCAGYYGRILKALHFLSNGEVVKKTAGDFVGSHVGESQTKTSQILEMSKGKVLVIDEAYNLNNNMYGKQVLDVLVEKVQGDESDDLAVLLIGYENEMLEMLRTQNPGLIRRFPLQHAFQFEDYTEHELLDILEWNCAKRSVTCPYDVAEALLKQLALQKTQPNFGNAGAVEQLIKHALGKAVSRPMVNGTTVLTLEDVGAEKESSQQDPLELLNKLYRMDEIKEKLSQLRNQMLVADREGSGLPEVGHFVFRGSPGTGKTTVARVMAEILHGMGVLATTKLVETSGLDLTAEHVGQTKKKVTDKLGEAKGGLLFIDEAYELGKGKYGEEAMTTLVAAMTDPSYAGMVIIIAGYPKDIDQMLDRNVGLKSRFNRFIDFPDWEAQDAVVFLSEKAEAENFEVESEAVLSLQHTFVELKKLGNFGNGRDAVRMWKEILQCRAQRVVDEPEEERTITESDAEKAGESILAARLGSGIPGKGVAADEDPMKLLDGLYRMDQIREQLSRLQMEMAVAEREGSERPEIGHFVFRGSPGTGKTTVARVMAQILHAMSALGTTKLVETSGLDLTGEYVGQTKAKVTEKLVEAKGGLLFIDEAYELGKGHFGEEAMTTLVAAMTDPSYSGMVIVIAGYPKDMDIMLNRNAGLKSRFTRFIDFPDWEPEDGVAFLRSKTEKEKMKMESSAELALQQTFAALKVLDGFGNGRDGVRVWKELLQCRAQRVFDSPEEVRTITAKDAVMAGDIVLAARRPPSGPVLSQSSLVKGASMLKVQEQQPRPPESFSEATQEEEPPEEASFQEQLEEKEAIAEETLEVEAEEDPEPDEDEEKSTEKRDPGVSDGDWEELELAKAAHAAHLDELRRTRDQARLEEERRRAQAIQEKIRRICPCPAGFNWYKSGGGWRCGGGSHFVSDAQLNNQFTR
ncbi:Serine/threonine-protein kinase mph1 [Phytophthora cinnamomi]|uniref:Serine/threonine-protein kinase mph1 n=1 Tax=Phytophthora cinnamomi TaxID=4785 RepID=UPI0035597073|nr:Serine/threonine-protein kinase mph1 [Phytophthora cinnamomi]